MPRVKPQLPRLLAEGVCLSIKVEQFKAVSGGFKLPGGFSKRLDSLTAGQLRRSRRPSREHGVRAGQRRRILVKPLHHRSADGLLDAT